MDIQGISSASPNAGPTVAAAMWNTSKDAADRHIMHLEEEEGADETFRRPENWAIILTAILAIIIAILGCLGNGLTIVALPYSKRLRNAATCFVVNLAVSEMLFCLSILPMSAAHLLYLSQGQQLFSNDSGALCSCFVFLRYVIIQAELLSIAGIAVNRCVLIANPKKYHTVFSNCNTAIVIGVIWIYSAIMLSLPLFQVFGKFSYNEITNECDFSEDDTKARQFFIMIGLLLPCCIIIASYVYIFIKARQSSMKVRQRAQANLAAHTTTQQTDAVRRRPATGLRRRDMRIARTIGVIFVVFLVCCFPVSFVHYKDNKGRFPTLLLLLHPLYWLQYCLNIFVYVLMNAQYRHAYVNFMAAFWPSFGEMTMKRFNIADDATTSDSRHRSRQMTPNSVRFVSVNRKTSNTRGLSRTPEGVESPGSTKRPGFTRSGSSTPPVQDTPL
ncbi:protein trapped in endoderm-1-like [Oratosquilla oratoria]|uniref:protein trapped in endoderm-1-like n=1 Tax=Oratosquilla oratoria TaxID=337810 RepID=UPI003F763DBA